MALGNNTTNLDHTNLDSPLNHPNEEESEVAEEVCEDVKLSQFDLSRVNLVEQLEENENLENECEMNNFLGFISKLEIFW